MDWSNMFNNDEEKPASPYADMFGGDPQVKHDAAMNDLKDVFQQALNNSPAPVSTPKSALEKRILMEMAEKEALDKAQKAKEDKADMANKFSQLMRDAPVMGVKGERGPEKQATVPQNFAIMANALYTPEEQAIIALDPKANPQAVLKWNRGWDNQFAQMSTLCNEQSNKMLDLTQDFAREHTKQNELFANIQDCIRKVDDLFSVKKTRFLGMTFQGQPKDITDKDLHATIDTVQKTLRNLKVKVDPFVENQLNRTVEGVFSLQRELGHAGLSLEVLKGEMEEDLYNRRLIRLESLKKIVELGSIGVDQLAKRVTHRVEVLEDFKMQAVPMVILKLQQYILNKDATALQGAFDNILNLRLE